MVHFKVTYQNVTSYGEPSISYFFSKNASFLITYIELILWTEFLYDQDFNWLAIWGIFHVYLYQNLVKSCFCVFLHFYP